MPTDFQIPIPSDGEGPFIIARPPAPEGTKLPQKWTFSFKYWKQIDYFGLDRSESAWFVSLIEKLHKLSEEEIERFLCDSRKRDGWRYHKINWGQKNIPVKIDDLDWVPTKYRSNQDEFAFVQFQVSQSLGRVVGFWDEYSIFNIVLLDPLHNMQPAKSYGYKVSPCNPLNCDYTTLLSALEDALHLKCENEDCGLVSYIQSIKTRKKELAEHGVCIFRLTDEDFEFIELLGEGGTIKDVYDIFQAGLEVIVNKT
ncbi:hypothetical protein [Salidesulfovibrio onnuriiensis]|uniref:hypothetical protein n=1 Tax=Salidesulfovibrio onnuriiensis TaxID=2583823 RepID=UPI0011C9E628|nr:hypothetical protein [Salidesulfovibrio onnuriiensis]